MKDLLLFRNKQSIVIFISLIAFITQIRSQQNIQYNCHYSCNKCIQDTYDRCLQCKDNYEYNQLVNEYSSLPGKFEQVSYGLCGGTISIQFNPMGIISLGIYIVLFWSKVHSKKNQSIFMTVSWLQSLSMLSLIPIPFYEPLSFLMHTFTPFMFITMLSKTYKTDNPNHLLIQNHQYRLGHFLVSQDISCNVYLLGPLILAIVMYIILIPLFLHARKRFCGEEKCRKFSQNLLNKVESVFYVAYFFIMQQTYVVLFTALRYTASPKAIVFTIIFIVTNIFMIVNYSIKPIPYFPNKKVQFIHVIQRILMPFMLLFSYEAYLIAMPSILLIARLLQARMNNKEYNPRNNQKQKYIAFFTTVLFIVIFTGILVIIEQLQKGETSIKAISFIISFIIVAFYGMTLTVQMFQVFYDYYRNQIFLQNMKNIMTRQQSTKMNLTTEGTQEVLKNNQIQLIFSNEAEDQEVRAKQPTNLKTKNKPINLGNESGIQSSSKKLKIKEKKRKDTNSAQQQKKQLNFPQSNQGVQLNKIEVKKHQPNDFIDEFQLKVQRQVAEKQRQKQGDQKQKIQNNQDDAQQLQSFSNKFSKNIKKHKKPSKILGPKCPDKIVQASQNFPNFQLELNNQQQDKNIKDCHNKYIQKAKQAMIVELSQQDQLNTIKSSLINHVSISQSINQNSENIRQVDLPWRIITQLCIKWTQLQRTGNQKQFIDQKQQINSECKQKQVESNQ